ncbi:MAG: hypothetical protein Q9184_002537 [Pyrenodesmia sp. 2 TL-2023]
MNLQVPIPKMSTRFESLQGLFQAAMKLCLAVALLFLSTLAASKSFLFAADQKAILDDSFPVPGENPLNFCSDPTKDILTIDNVDLDPKSPEKGKDLVIKARGNFTAKVEKGAYIDLSVKYGVITLIKTEADLCEQMKEVDEKCPLEGAKAFTKKVSLPKQIPPGTYAVLADVYTEDDNRITCLKAMVHFT